VLARSNPIPLGPLVVRTTLDPEIRDRLAEAMLRVHEADPEAANVVIRGGNRFTAVAKRSNPTLKSIAALSGVSYATVSRVVNGAGHVAPATALRVSAIIKEVGYVPNGNARLLQGQQAPLVGLVTSLRRDRRVPKTKKLVATIREELAAVGIPLVLCPADGPLAESLILDVLRDRRLGALIVTAAHVDDPDLVAMARQGYAVIAVGELGREVPQGIVVAAVENAARTVVAALGWTPKRRTG
jgi:LacI family transcriptional regulator